MRGLADYQNLRTVKQLVSEAPFLTEGQLRWWMFNREKNGLDSALIKIDKRVYVDKDAFNGWLESRRLAPKNDN